MRGFHHHAEGLTDDEVRSAALIPAPDLQAGNLSGLPIRPALRLCYPGSACWWKGRSRSRECAVH